MLFRSWDNESIRQWAVDNSSIAEYIATRAAQWSADQELEACCLEIADLSGFTLADKVRIARRPKSFSLKEQALAELEKVEMLWNTDEFGPETLKSLDTIRRALERLQELEEQQ